MNRYATIGLGVLAGAVLLEAGLIPGIVIGGSALLAARYLPQPGRRQSPDAKRVAQPRCGPGAALPVRQNDAQLISLPAGLRIKQAVAKTITFRITVTGLDFSTNYLVLGELAMAAGLSTFSLVVGPIFYFTHETCWNYLVPADGDVDLGPWRAASAEAPSDARRIVISRALAKTITFRMFATVMDFTTNYIVIADAVTAAVLTAFGFVLGPFVYLGHEMLWDYYSIPQRRGPSAPVPVKPALSVGHSYETDSVRQ